MPEGEIVVVGSAVVDRTFQVETLPFPGETAVATEVVVRLGGKGANQAAAARLLGAPVLFLGCVGADEGGRATQADLADRGVDARLRVVEDAPTAEAAVLVDTGGENQIVVYPGANAHLSPEQVEAQADRIRAATLLVAQLETPTEASRAAARLVREGGGRALLNAAPAQAEAAELFPDFDVVVLNRAEAELVAGVGISTVDDALAALRGLRDMGAETPVISLGGAGAVTVEYGRGIHVAAPEAEVVDTTGAGDALVGALAAFLREGEDVKHALQRACAYAALAVRRPGTRAAYATRAEFDAAWTPRDE